MDPCKQPLAYDFENSDALQSPRMIGCWMKLQIGGCWGNLRKCGPPRIVERSPNVERNEQPANQGIHSFNRANAENKSNWESMSIVESADVAETDAEPNSRLSPILGLRRIFQMFYIIIKKCFEEVTSFHGYWANQRDVGSGARLCCVVQEISGESENAFCFGNGSRYLSFRPEQ